MPSSGNARLWDAARGEQFEQFRIDPRDFPSAREGDESVGTRLDQMTGSLADAAEIVNRNFSQQEESGRFTNVISPMVIPERRSSLWLLPVVILSIFGLVGGLSTILLDRLPGIDNVALTLFGPHYWLLLGLIAAYGYWRASTVMVPDGCQALITRFGKLETVAPAGRVLLLNPWKQVSYLVNTTKEYPYNAPIREAPTAGRVNASVDLFLQFRIDDPVEFIFTLGGVKGFEDKLQNAISEVTRALIYEQKAEAIYDLVGETTQGLLETLNAQFLPAVRFVNANITHAEPSSQEYRIDLAAPEMVRVAKEAYTYQYELQLAKEQNEGELNKELASLRETLSGIGADIAGYQAQIDTAREREINRANADARQRLVEAESAAKANAALLEAQALDIRAVSGAASPEILEYRFQQDVLDELAGVADRLPQVVHVGHDADQGLDFLSLAQRMLGTGEAPLYSTEELGAIRARLGETRARIQERAERIGPILAEERGRRGSEPSLTPWADGGSRGADGSPTPAIEATVRIVRPAAPAPAAPPPVDDAGVANGAAGPSAVERRNGVDDGRGGVS
ncbi:MAG: hypothetical protein AVDCRST_MAG88-2709 [uncultured Thermomicrobiales bacterium]|uniref:Band 7 domain-containing protein n=1 Tax=uncultured Thermomicrobiales bacterium TaxID=1645740 RepID=A0A6J4VFZ6_9BACT|nr:MAG: hypothetical protein AVDCRST_MAG88-2709 [uncultured Thermomicrobiales bacterium]